MESEEYLKGMGRTHMVHENQHPILLLDVEDLRIEAVLDSGFLGAFELSPKSHAHTYYELILCRNGVFSMEFADGNTMTMDTDGVCLIPPGVYHSAVAADEVASKLAVRFICTRMPLSGRVGAVVIKALEERKEPVCLGKQPEILELAAQLCREMGSCSLARESCVKAILTQLMILAIRLVCRGTSGAATVRDDTVENAARRLRIEDFFSDRYAEPVTEDTLAAYMHISRRQLSRVLRQLYGSSFRSLLIDIRLSNAARLLRTTELSAEEVAYRVGYGSVSGFYEAFRKRYGMSAGSYRRQLFR